MRLCESYRIGSKIRHKSIITLGLAPALDTREKKKELADRIEELLTGSKKMFPMLLAKNIEDLAQKFYKKIKEKKTVKIKETIAEKQNDTKETQKKDFEKIDMNSISTEEVKEVGSEWLCYQAIEKLGLNRFLQEQGWEQKRINIGLIHLISKAIYPASEHKTAQWIQENSAVAELFSIESQKINRHHLYKASRELYAIKDKIEPFLSRKTNELFDLEDKIILYDLTNTYFEGRKAASELAQFGRSKEKRSDAKLIALALVTNAEGFVKYSKIYKGNIADCATLEATVTELSVATSIQKRKLLVVIDAGIATEDNLKMLKEKGYDYLCVTRQKLKEYTVVNVGKTPVKIKDNRGNEIEIQQVKKDNEPDAFLYIRSKQKVLKEVSMASHFSVRYEEELNHLSASLQKKGSTKKSDKVCERIGRIKERYPTANKFYQIEIQSKDGIATELKWSKKPMTVKNTDGVYFLRCSKTTFDEKDFWNIYNTLTEIEATFRILKTDLSLRPVYHQKDIHSEAHIFLGILSYSIVATIRYQLKQKKIHYDWSNIVRKMNTQKSVTTTMKNEAGKKIIIKTCSNPSTDMNDIYQAMNYKKMPFYRKKFVFPENGK